jgi:putative endonuclease
MHFVYVIFSERLNRYYVGHTENLEHRLEQHNSGLSKYTSRATDWQRVYFEEYSNRILAQKREREIKNKKSRKYIEWLINK